MEDIKICLTKTKSEANIYTNNRRSINIFSNMIRNKYIIRNPEIDKFRDIIQSYYDEQKKKFDNFTVCVMWKKNDLLINEISAPSTITLEKPIFFQPCMIELPIVIRVSRLDFLDTFDRNIKNEVDEINIFVLSDLKNMTLSQHLAQPKSMLSRKLIRSFFEEDFADFD